MRNVVVLGATGSIGRQAIDVMRAHPDLWRIIGLGAGGGSEALERCAAELGVAHTGLGSDGAVGLAGLEDADIVLNGIVGAAGLRASLAALEAGKTLALANKESLVTGGTLCLRAAERGGGTIVPVDSEHAALAQALAGAAPASVERIILTASGGPFRIRPVLDDVTPEEALAHPTWSMGPKITIDCATLMNKGLEVIEAHFLFGFDFDRIDVAVHPQSIVHGIVELVDGSLLMQAAPTDMRLPIQAALAHPDRIPASFGRVDLAAIGTLSFEDVDDARFPALRLAYEAGIKGGTYPAVLNAANEEAVNAFLERVVSFTSIPRVVEEVLSAHEPGSDEDLDEVLRADEWARTEARRVIARMGARLHRATTPRAGS